MQDLYFSIFSIVWETSFLEASKDVVLLCLVIFHLWAGKLLDGNWSIKIQCGDNDYNEWDGSEMQAAESLNSGTSFQAVSDHGKIQNSDNDMTKYKYNQKIWLKTKSGFGWRMSSKS